MSCENKSSIVFADVLEYTRDGEWGYGEEKEGTTLSYVIRGTDFQDVLLSKLDTLPKRYIDNRKLETKQLKIGDIILETAGGTKNQLTGRTAILRRSLFEKASLPIVCASFSRFLRVKKKLCNPEYLYYFLRNLYAEGRMSVFNVQHTGVSRFQYTDFSKRTVLCLPSIPEQSSVAKFLSQIDEMIELNQRMNKTLEAVGRAVFKRWFVDFEFPNEEGKPYKSSGGNMIYNEEWQKEVPKEWRVGCIEDVADVIGGGTPSTKVAAYFTSNGLPWLTPKDLSGYEGKFIDKGATDLSEEGLKNSSAKLMPRGTILFTSRAPIGYVAVALNDIATNQGFKSLVPRDNMKSEYLYQYMKKITSYVQSISSGSTFGEVTGSTMKKIKILIPQFGVLEKFEVFMNPLNSRIINNVFSTKTLTEIRDSLLPRLMSGKIRISEERSFD